MLALHVIVYFMFIVTLTYVGKHSLQFEEDKFA